LDGWSLSLAEENYLRTGYKINRLLDVHLVTDEDVQNRTGFAAKIGAVTDAARPLAIGLARRKNGN
jgi:pyruvate,water dikinase